MRRWDWFEITAAAAVAALLAAALALLIATAADAVPTTRAALDRAITAAETYWRNDPEIRWCPVEFRREKINWQVDDPWLGTTHNGGTCAAWTAINPNTVGPLRWRDLCTVVVHEYGHMLGHPHSVDPFNVMYPRPTGHTVSVCLPSKPPPFIWGWGWRWW